MKRKSPVPPPLLRIKKTAPTSPVPPIIVKKVPPKNIERTKSAPMLGNPMTVEDVFNYRKIKKKEIYPKDFKNARLSVSPVYQDQQEDIQELESYIKDVAKIVDYKLETQMDNRFMSTEIRFKGLTMHIKAQQNELNELRQMKKTFDAADNIMKNFGLQLHF
tara:strand:- start:1884 stop:2369 length:486 start_codon:yes stop_codon:yes gene_type:complete